MAIPHDYRIQSAVAKLISDAPAGSMHCKDIYHDLAKDFPELTEDEVSIPYGNSVSHWANRVQFARLHLVQQGLLARAYTRNDRGYWTITGKGRQWVTDGESMVEQLLQELESLPKPVG